MSFEFMMSDHNTTVYMMKVHNTSSLSCFLASYKASFKEIKYHNSGSWYNPNLL